LSVVALYLTKITINSFGKKSSDSRDEFQSKHRKNNQYTALVYAVGEKIWQIRGDNRDAQYTIYRTNTTIRLDNLNERKPRDSGDQISEPKQ